MSEPEAPVPEAETPEEPPPEAPPPEAPLPAAEAPSWNKRLLDVALAYGPVVLATFLLAKTTIGTILDKAIEPAVPLDDAYIHFQYARSLAEGRFFSFVAGEGYTSGATSLLWPALLAPAYLLGMKGTTIIWAAWALGFGFLAMLAIETKRLAEKLVDGTTALGAAACVLAFGGYAWFAASGMEVTLLAWILAWTARLCAEWAEDADRRTLGRAKLLLALAVVGPLARPEGVIASTFVLATLAIFSAPDAGKVPGRALAAVALVGPLLPPLINRVLTGHWSTTTTQVKWMIGNPYYVGQALVASIRGNLDIFTKTLLDGREWSAIFIPPGSRPVAAAAMLAIPIAGYRSGKGVRALLVVALALSMALPTTYISFLWNRLRYLWPFAFAWFIGLACAARVVGDLAALFRPRFRAISPVLVGMCAGMFAHHLPWAMDDVATSAWAIHNQQVLLGRWAKEHLPETARIGLNDTGAIAYFSGRKTFDVVGLTTPEEARYWVAGPGSRFEHYERLALSHPDRLPTHFFVYPHWMACDPVLGKELTRATVREQSILGGPTMEARLARWDLLHSGEAPHDHPGTLVDALDVADLESEAAHGYRVLTAYTSEVDNQVRTKEYRDKTVADGGRLKRVLDVFSLRVPVGKPFTLVARWSAEDDASVEVKVGGLTLPPVALDTSLFGEYAMDLPAGAAPRVDVEVKAADGATFGSYHYWVIER